MSGCCHSQSAVRLQAADLPWPLSPVVSFSAKIMPILPVLVKVQWEEIWAAVAPVVVVGGGGRSSPSFRG